LFAWKFYVWLSCDFGVWVLGYAFKS